MGALKALPLLLLAGLAACQPARTGSTNGGNNLCTPFPTATTTSAGAPATAPPVAADPAGAVEDCLHRWAYALAPSSDDASHVAEATLAVCGSALAHWNQQMASAGGGEGAPIQAPSLLTGEPTTPIAEHLSFAQGRALFYVVQARAGKCPAPPMSNGAPVGLARD